MNKNRNDINYQVETVHKGDREGNEHVRVIKTDQKLANWAGLNSATTPFVSQQNQFKCGRYTGMLDVCVTR